VARRPGGERALTSTTEPRPSSAGHPHDTAPRAPLGLYLHIPFCASLCRYCTFTRCVSDTSLELRYVAALAREIRAGWRAAETGAPHASRADTIYFGGGTPSLLDASDIAALIRACRETFDIDPGAEITLEANPETVTAGRLAGYRAAGVNRLSLGVQSFKDSELRRLGRIHDQARARQAFADARRAGFDNVSLDLILWLPGQSRADLRESVDALVELGPEHASAYLLEVYPDSPLAAEMERHGWTRVSDDEAADMYLETMARLEEAGYQQYEISNLARPDRRSRHNLKYWTDGAWVGFGCGAHSTVGDERWNNVLVVPEYLALVEAGASPVSARRRLSARERVEDALFMGLRLAEGISLARIRADYGVDVWQRWGTRLAWFEEAGLLERDEHRLWLTRRGMLLANDVMTTFLEAGSTVK
jgi:putative oxygen-independent coproporphyrinogen III oxidase